MYTQILIKCEDQKLSLIEAPQIASGGVNDVKVIFTFCELWTGLKKMAVFHRPGSSKALQVVLEEDGSCLVPWEVMTNQGTVRIGVLGVGDGITRPTDLLKLEIVQGTIQECTKPEEPTPKLYEQLLEALREKTSEVPKDTVLYTKQTLTEEQQMQARKNQGLYYKEEQPVLLDDIPIVINELYVPDGFKGDKSDNIVVEIIDDTAGTTQRYHCEKTRTSSSFWGANVWYGNIDLFPDIVAVIEHENQYPDYPFIIYWDGMMTGKSGIVLATDLLSTIRMGSIKIYDADQTETVYVPVPEEYLPGKLLPNPTPDMEGMIPQVSGGMWTSVPMPEGGSSGSGLNIPLINTDDEPITVTDFLAMGDGLYYIANKLDGKNGLMRLYVNDDGKRCLDIYSMGIKCVGVRVYKDMFDGASESLDGLGHMESGNFVKYEQGVDYAGMFMGVNEEGYLWPMDIPESGGTEEAWELLCDVTTEEVVNKLEQTWIDNPKKKIRVVIETPAASTATNYAPMTFWTGDLGWNHNFKIYPPAIPTTYESRSTYDVGVTKTKEGKVLTRVGVSISKTTFNKQLVDLNITPGTEFGGVIPAGDTGWWEPYDIYGASMNPQLTGITVSTYAEFAIGTRVRVWGC